MSEGPGLEFFSNPQPQTQTRASRIVTTQWSNIMPDKSKGTKKKSPATPARPAKAATPPAPAKSASRSKVAKAKTSQRKSALRVGPPGAVTATSDKSKNASESRALPPFAEARTKAIEELVALIEAAEAQLLSLKRAKCYEDLSSNGALK